MAHNEFAKRVRLWSLYSQENMEEYQRLERQHAPASAPPTTGGVGYEYGPPAVYGPTPVTTTPAPVTPAPAYADPEEGLDTGPATTAPATSPVFQAMVKQAALPGQVAQQVAQAQQPAPVYGPDPAPAPAPVAAPVFQYVDPVTQVVTTFGSQAELNAFIDNLGKAEISAPPVVPPPVVPPAAVEPAPIAPPQTFSALDPTTGQMVSGFASQALADKAGREWLREWNEAQDAIRIAEEDAATALAQQQADLALGATGADTMAITYPGAGTANPWTTGTQWGNFGTAFGQLPAQSQYQAMMRQGIPGYQMPGYESAAMRGFAPTWGSYMLGAPSTAREAEGMTYRLQTAPAGGTAPASFGDWYATQRPMGGPTSAPTYPTDLGVGGQGYGGSASWTALPGWSTAQQFSGLTPGEEPWNKLATGNLALSEAMEEADAVQAMALGQYYGGGGPRGGFAGRMVERAMQNLFNRWQAGALTQGVTSPAGFLNYLGGLNPDRFPVYTAV